MVIILPKSRLEKTLPEVELWAKDNWPSHGWLDKYLVGEIERTGLAADDLHTVGMHMCCQSLVEAKHNNLLAMAHMSYGFCRRAIGKAISIKRLEGMGRTANGHLDDFTDLMFGAIALGRPDVAKALYTTVLGGLKGGYGVNDGHNLEIGTTLRYSAFGLSIIGNWLEQPLDLDKYALPRDPAWAPLVSAWRVPDPDKVLPALLATCDIHVERIARTAREADSGNFEFDTPLVAVHPTEILAVLRLRDLLGLPNPLQIDHPLMQTPYARITCTPEFLTTRTLRDELLDKFLATVRLRDPGVLPQGL